MRIEQLEYFLTIARYGSISQAANNLYIGQPTLSAAISSLERELDTKLFKRTKAGMELTPMGQELLPLTEKAVDAFYHIKKRATEKVITKYNIHVACDPANSNVAVLDIVCQCKKLYPTVTIHVHEMLPGEVMRSVIEGKTTIGLSYTEDHAIPRHQEYASDLNLVMRPLYTDELFLCCSADHPYAQLKCISFQQLANEPIAVFEGFLQQGIIKHVNAYQDFPNICGFSSYENIKRAIVNQQMLAILPKMATYQDIYFTQGLIKTIPLVDHDTTCIHYLTYCKEHPLSEVEKEILTLIDTYFHNLRCQCAETPL